MYKVETKCHNKMITIAYYSYILDSNKYITFSNSARRYIFIVKYVKIMYLYTNMIY